MGNSKRNGDAQNVDDDDSIGASKFFLKKIKENSYKNIFVFGIGGSYEGPKLLHEFTETKDNVLYGHHCCHKCWHR